ncbi:hypothetical protein [Streptomyces microflavus]|uniref:hypothetical protein n=1 Tax=Streptomyces microflavus TaxID=1919 RepID=UPI00381A51FA
MTTSPLAAGSHAGAGWYDAGATLAGAPTAYALPGDSGDIDIRSVSWHSRGDRDGVEVCKFVLSASNFESFPSVPWTITEQPPTVPPGTTLLDTLPLINGSARSEQYRLPEGTYQLVWVVPAGPKQKSFKVECPDRGHGGGKPHKPQRPVVGPRAVRHPHLRGCLADPSHLRPDLRRYRRDTFNAAYRQRK